MGKMNERCIYVSKIMQELDEYAKLNTTDPKIYVGACVGRFEKDQFVILGEGCNANLSYNERELGHTYREFLFGSTDVKFRPWDKIIHGEENAIVDAIRRGNNGEWDTLIVTRYPCEKCAQLAVYKGVKIVFYGRSFEISEGTAKIFADAGVEVYHLKEYVGQEDDDNKGMLKN